MKAMKFLSHLLALIMTIFVFTIFGNQAGGSEIVLFLLLITVLSGLLLFVMFLAGDRKWRVFKMILHIILLTFFTILVIFYMYNPIGTTLTGVMIAMPLAAETFLLINLIKSGNMEETE